MKITHIDSETFESTEIEIPISSKVIDMLRSGFWQEWDHGEYKLTPIMATESKDKLTFGISKRIEGKRYGPAIVRVTIEPMNDGESN